MKNLEPVDEPLNETRSLSVSVALKKKPQPFLFILLFLSISLLLSVCRWILTQWALVG